MITRTHVGNTVQLVECLPSLCKAQALSTELHKLVMLGDAYNPRAQEVKPGRSGVQSYPWLHSAFKVSLGYMTKQTF